METLDFELVCFLVYLTTLSKLNTLYSSVKSSWLSATWSVCTWHSRYPEKTSLNLDAAKAPNYMLYSAKWEDNCEVAHGKSGYGGL